MKENAMLNEDDGAGDTACSYTNQFLDQAIQKIDAVFGSGYALANPALVGAYLQASATNLNAFMIAASALSDPSEYDDLMMSMEALESIALSSKPDKKKPSKKKR